MPDFLVKMKNPGWAGVFREADVGSLGSVALKSACTILVLAQIYGTLGTTSQNDQREA